MNTAILDVAIGLIFIYLLTSLICSVLQEFIANISNWRAKNLRSGIQLMLDDPTMTGLTASLYAHPRIRAFAERNRLPSYISSTAFAEAVVDALKNANRLDSQLSGPLGPFVRKAGDDLDKLRVDLAAWFDESMARLSGYYKRHVQRMLLILGFIVAVALNIDSLRIAESLWTTPTLQKALVEQAMTYYTAHPQTEAPTYEALNSALKDIPLPIGWRSAHVPAFSDEKTSITTWLGVLAGWMITALATSLGTQFWFNTLGKTLQLRATGKKPDDAASTEESAKI